MAQQPNIILIITDQQRFDTIGALGFDYMDTPTLDRLVNEGTTFTNCHVTAPSCVPSRASLFTGLYPHSSGVYRNGDGWSRTWVEQLATAGYRCVNIGKMHTEPYGTPAGFHERYVVENKDRYMQGRYYFDEWDKAVAAHGLVKPQRELYRKRADYKNSLGAFEWELPDHLHSDFFVGNLACWWLDTYPQTQPLFLQVGFPGPHPPYDPIPRYAKRYMSKDLPLADVSQDDLDSQPRVFKNMRNHNAEVDHDSVVHKLEPTRAERHRLRAFYLANITMIDEKIGEILSALERNGYLENSVVIFTSDHGDCLSDHGHSQKWTMYDTITRMPVIVWSPSGQGNHDGRGPAAGKRIHSLWQLFDVGPTILELAGVEVPTWFEAQSMLHAIRGGASQAAAGREYVFAEQGPDTNLHGTELLYMVRSTRWKLVGFIDDNEGQLFDLESDPEENNNLWNSPEAAHHKKELQEAYFKQLMESGVRTSTWKLPWR